MQTAYKFKLRPNQEQSKKLEDWQHKVGYIQNRSLGDRTTAYNNTFVEGSYCDLFTKREINPEFLYCDLASQALTSPLHCSVSKSASLGNPWKEDIPSRRRVKPGKDGKEKPFQPKRSAFEMHSSWLTEFKKELPEYQTVNANVLQQALRHVDTAFNKFFSGQAGYPNFKSHKDITFEYPPGTVAINGNHIKFPGLGTMRFFKSREIPESWEIRTVTISRQADGWYVAVLLRDEAVPHLPLKPLKECQTIQGADVGIKKLVALSDETMIANPQFLKKSERTQRIRQRRVSRKEKGSNNRKKAAKRLARTHQKIRRQREDYQWKAAKKIAGNADITAFEDLNIKGMKSRCKPKVDPETGKYVKNGQAAKAALNRAISDASWYSLRKKTEHQAAKLGNHVILVEPRYSSLECPECHHISKANRVKEKFVCEECSFAADADTVGGVNCGERGFEKLGIESLRVVRPKVTVKEATETSRASLETRGEPNNPAESTVKHRQLRLLTVKSVVVEAKPKVKPKRKTQPPLYTQLDLFNSFDWDARASTS